MKLTKAQQRTIDTMLRMGDTGTVPVDTTRQTLDVLRKNRILRIERVERDGKPSVLYFLTDEGRAHASDATFPRPRVRKRNIRSGVKFTLEFDCTFGNEAQAEDRLASLARYLVLWEYEVLSKHKSNEVSVGSEDLPDKAMDLYLAGSIRLHEAMGRV